MGTSVLQWMMDKYTTLHPYNEMLTTKRNKLLKHAIICMYLKVIILSKKYWSQMVTYIRLHLCDIVKVVLRTEQRHPVVGVWRM